MPRVLENNCDQPNSLADDFVATVKSEYRNDEISYDFIGNFACRDRREIAVV